METVNEQLNERARMVALSMSCLMIMYICRAILSGGMVS